MQKVFLWSSVTYECTQVTPSSALVPTTDMHAWAPASVNGISRPSRNVRSTMNLAIRTSFRSDASKLCGFIRAHIGEKAQRVLNLSAQTSGDRIWPLSPSGEQSVGEARV